MELSNPRIRFNHGYHNGANPKLKCFTPTSNHFDKVYVAGWEAGKQDFADGIYVGSSNAAWKVHKASKAKARAIRKALPNMWEVRV